MFRAGPRVRRDVCDPSRPYVRCPGRILAEAEGAMWWEADIRGYVHKDFTRSVSWRTKYHHPETPEPPPLYRLERCPHCSMPLPDVQAIADATCDPGEGWE